MKIEEYQKVQNYTYEEYCNYLKEKYGMVPNKYGSQHNRRSDEGLFIHHIGENRIASLSNRAIAKVSDPKYQEPEWLCYCNYLEHLLLHIMIGEETAGNENLGLNGPFTYILPALLGFFKCGYRNTRINENYFNVIKGENEVFFLLLERYNNVVQEADILLDHNQTLYAEVEKNMDEKGRALVVLGTGLGKTTTALHYLKTHDCRGLVIGPNNLIRDGWNRHYQWCDTTTYQSFAKSYKDIDYSQYGLIILDEAHHAGYDAEADKGARVWSQGIEYAASLGMKIMGLTATPERSDKINIGSTLFDGCVCEGLALEDAIEQGIVHPFSYITAIYDTDKLVADIKEKYDDGSDEMKNLIGQLDLSINNTPTVKEIFENHMPTDTKRKGIIFIQEIADKEYVMDIFKDIYPDMEFRAIDSKMEYAEIAKNRKWFENTDEGYLLAVNMISEGAHYKGVNTLIMFRRTNSYLVYAQQLGRAVTLTKDENPNAIVFDLVNNVDNVEYNDRKVDKNKKHTVKRILEVIKKRAAKSGQVIVADETRDLVKCIKKIKDAADRSWTEWEDEIIRTYYPTEGAEGCMKRINERWKEI